ncbi:GTP cyclohydrolase [Vibrio phage D479]
MFDKSKANAELGKSVEARLLELGIQTPTTDLVNVPAEEKIEKIEGLMTQVLETLGLDLADDSLVETPRRVAKMYVKELMSGLTPDHFPKCTTVENKFSHGDEFVLVKNIKVKSLCEHHLMPFSDFGDRDFGCTIAYIPGDKVLGLSKLNRIVEYFARRPQVQERLTSQICEALKHILGTDDVIVHMGAKHTCVSMRGVEDEQSVTTTLASGGRFAEKDSGLRREFLSNL